MKLIFRNQKMPQCRHNTLRKFPPITPYIIVLANERKDEVLSTSSTTDFESRNHEIKLSLIYKLVVDRVCEHCQLSIAPTLVEVARRGRNAGPVVLEAESVHEDFLIDWDLLVGVLQSYKVVDTF